MGGFGVTAGLAAVVAYKHSFLISFFFLFLALTHLFLGSTKKVYRGGIQTCPDSYIDLGDDGTQSR